MQDQDLATWGKSLLEEIVLQAALDVPDSASALKDHAVTLPFRITADAAGRLLVTCQRVGDEDLVAHIDIPDGRQT